MRRWIYFFIFFAFLFACDTASTIKPPYKNYFIKYFGGDGDQKAVDLIVNTDGTFFILGNSQAAPDSTQKVYLAKANAQGELIKEITYGADMQARDFVLTSDGKLAVVANKNISTGNVDVLLSRFTLDLAPIDNALLYVGTSNTTYSEYANSLTELSNRDFIVEGYLVGDQAQSEELHIKVYNQSSLVMAGGEWQQVNYAGTGKNIGVKTLQHNSTTYYTFGTSNAAYQTTNEKFWAYPLPSNGSANNNGDLSMFEKAGAGAENSLTDVVKIVSGGYLLVGISSASTYSLKVAVTLGTDSVINFKPAGVFKDLLIQDLGKGTADPFATAYSSINNYNFIAANIYNAQSMSDIFLTKINNDLTSAWGSGVSPNYVQFGGDGDDTAAAVAELPDGHIMVLGTMQLGNPPAQFKIALMKLNSSGKLSD